MWHVKGTYNHVEIIGRLGSDPELKYTRSRVAVATFSVATISAHKKSNQAVYETEWNRVVVWGTPVKFVGQHALKGSLIHVVGSLKTRKWKKDSVDHYMTEITCHKLQILDKFRTSSSQNNCNYQPDFDSDLGQLDDELPF